MSHELRTPLNSLLILAKLLADNEDGNLTDEAGRVRADDPRRGHDLLELINDILDLSKVEAGKMEVNVDRGRARRRSRDYVERTFRPVAEQKALEFDVDGRRRTRRRRSRPTSSASSRCCKNLLSNAFKFTENGGGHAADRAAPATASLRDATLAAADAVIAFSVVDTGIGIADGQAAG